MAPGEPKVSGCRAAPGTWRGGEKQKENASTLRCEGDGVEAFWRLGGAVRDLSRRRSRSGGSTPMS